MSSLRLIPVAGRPLEVTPQHSGAVVGRSSEADITLEDGSVSRRHARLEWRGEAWFVVDLGSANGTFVNGERIGESRVEGGHEIRFGSLSLRAEVGDPAGSDATVAIPSLTAVMPAQSRPRDPELETEGGPELDAVRAAVVSPPPPPVSPPPPPVAPSRAGAPGAAAAAPVGQMAPPAAPKQGRGPLFWVLTGCGGCLLAIVLFVAAIGGGVWMMTQGPAEDTRAQLERIGAGQLDAAYAELAESYQARLSREQFEALVAAHPALQGYAESTFNSRSVENDTARLAGSLSSASGGVEPVRIELVKERGQWRITSIRFGIDDAPAE